MRKKVYIVALNEVPYVPLVYGYLRVFCETDPLLVENYSFEEPFFYKKPVREIVDTLINPEIVGLSCYVWNFQRNIKIARLTKKKFPNCKIVLGGPHVPERSEQLFEEFPFIDIAVHGEGEHAFRELLRENLKENSNWENVPGISFVQNGIWTSNGPGVKLPKEIDLPSPYLLGYFDKVIEECHERKLKFIAPWETNRGCPYGCTFCDWGMLTMNKIRCFDEDRLYKEIAFFSKNKVHGIFICDANFGILKRDIELAKSFTQVKLATGYPTQIKVNFAKNTNDKVFEISKSWNDADLLMGTTISLQSNDDDVLEAIKRKNIKKENFYQLQKQYADVGIDTYTELILGLPGESSDSFKEGINQILLSDSHDDLRVYELNLLPNSPMNKPDYIEKYGIKTMQKYLFSKKEGQDEDEVELIDLVIETASMNTKDWIDSNIFCQLIQTLHNGCYTRYISIFAYRTAGIDYRTFYEGLTEFYITKDSFFGGLVRDLIEMYEYYLSDTTSPMSTLIHSQEKLAKRIEKYGNRRGWTVSDYCWLVISSSFEKFYDEIGVYLNSIIGDTDSHLLSEVIAYQKDRMFQIDYNPEVGKSVEYAYDFPTYFDKKNSSSETILEKKRVKIKYTDKHLGINGNYKIEMYDPVKFAKAAIGMSFPIVRVRHYKHQADHAVLEYVTNESIEYEPEPER